MATVGISAVEIPDAGYDLIGSADFETLVAGAGNGVEFTYNVRDFVVLKNTVASVANFTFKVPTESKYSERGITVGDVTVQLADGSTTPQYWIYLLSAIFQQASGNVIIECDVAGEVLVLRK